MSQSIWVILLCLNIVMIHQSYSLIVNDWLWFIMNNFMKRILNAHEYSWIQLFLIWPSVKTSLRSITNILIMNLLSINYFFRKFSMSLFSFRKITLNWSFIPPIQYWSIIFFANLIGIDNQSRKILNSVAFPPIHFKFTLFCLFYITFRECTMHSLSFSRFDFRLSIFLLIDHVFPIFLIN